MKWIKQALSPLIGSDAERYAQNYLEQQGLIFLSKNYRCRSGEIDLIMQDETELVFIEVKFRSNQSHGTAIEYFHSSKQRKFISAVMCYMQEKNLNPSIVPHRIDLIGIDRNNRQQNVTWLKNITLA
ncbi:YraN family protein [Paraglaciecola sp. L3A3]|uniref:YraN family protein n=1 Tax=Paraglaciecola sp. L3A3 TaxID=2686358 RepID=UPI00131E6A7C|nr:YraN family protein [Paraglaciecola sp. L3A3]